MAMIALFSWLCQAVFLAVVAYFAFYVLLELRVLMISRKVERRELTELALSNANTASGTDRKNEFFPPVSVLLPVCNEPDVIERLIDAVCRLSYPAVALEILVLDDSSDHTTELARAKINDHAARGVDIRLIQRPDQEGHKAGNLTWGIQQARGEFFAIFDADFVPPVDFLEKTVPCFKDPRLGFLHTGIGYENAGVSFLTRFQATAMSHQQYVTVGLNENGDIASLSGSSCVWRKTCVEALGGWDVSVVSEDIDLNYRARFDDWEYAYLREVVSMSILPDTISAFRVQRERWARGLTFSACKHAKQMFVQRMSLMQRMQAISVMFSSLLLSAIYVLILLSLPLVCLVRFGGTGVMFGGVALVVLATVWGLAHAFGARRGGRVEKHENLLKLLWDTWRYVAMFLLLSWYYFAGSVRARLGIQGEFNRTPKGKVSRRRSGMPRINMILMAGESLTFLYSLAAIWGAAQKGNYFLLPLNVTACLGFGMALWWTWQEHRAS